MDAIAGFFTAHPDCIKAIVIIALLVVAFYIFKKFLKLSVVLIIIGIAAIGYSCYSNQLSMSGIWETSKNMYEDSKVIFGKAKDVSKDINKLIDAGK